MKLFNHLKVQPVHAHCDGPCGVYDPSQARVAAEAVVSMTKKILDLEQPTDGDAQAYAAYQNSLTRYVMIKEEEAQAAKDHLLVLWTDFFKPEHLEEHPDLHDLFWKAAKEASSAKQEVSMHHAEALLDYTKQIHELFWKVKGKDVEWHLANG